MRVKDPAKMQKIIDAIEYYRFDCDVNPSIPKIAERVGLSISTTHDYLMEMNEKGMIDYTPGNIRTSRTKRIATGKKSAPLVGSIPCGVPALETEEIEEYIQLPTAIFGTEDMYILKASGDSMIDESIEDGDWVVVEKKTNAKPNDIVVALTDEGENTLKMLSKKSSNGKIILEYRNEEKYPGKTIVLDSMRIQGIVRFVIKKR